MKNTPVVSPFSHTHKGLVSRYMGTDEGKRTAYLRGALRGWHIYSASVDGPSREELISSVHIYYRAAAANPSSPSFQAQTTRQANDSKGVITLRAMRQGRETKTALWIFLYLALCCVLSLGWLSSRQRSMYPSVKTPWNSCLRTLTSCLLVFCILGRTTLAIFRLSPEVSVWCGYFFLLLVSVARIWSSLALYVLPRGFILNSSTRMGFGVWRTIVYDIDSIYLLFCRWSCCDNCSIIPTDLCYE